MKRIYHCVQGLCMAIFLSVTPLLAQQINQGFSYQAVVRNNDGSIKKNEVVSINFSIYQGLIPTGILVFSESHPLTSNDYGLIVTTIGENSPSFGQINWETGQFYMEISINGQTIDTIIFGSVPYSEVSKVATDMNLYDLKNVGGAAPIPGQSLVWNGFQWGPANSGSSLWSNNLGSIYYNNGTVNIGKPAGSAFNYSLDIAGVTNLSGELYVRDNGNAIYLSDPAYAATGGNSSILGTLAGAGFLQQKGPNGNPNVFLGGNGNLINHGALALRNSNGDIRVWMTMLNAGQGYLQLEGANGNDNIVLSSPTSNDNHGFIAVKDGAGTNQVGMYVDASGNGIVFKDINSFRMDHPEEPGKEIWYASIEGPEAAAYERGTAELVNGEAHVAFSDHFELVANPQTLTMILTPLDASSLGMAVIEKHPDGFTVKELHNGSGSYSFDWEAKAVRKGFEEFRVIRNADELQINTSGASIPVMTEEGINHQ